MVLTGKRDKNPEANINLAHVWSGKVHRLCALWSAEVLSFTEIDYALNVGFNWRLVFEVTSSTYSLLGTVLIATMFIDANRYTRIQMNPGL